MGPMLNLGYGPRGHPTKVGKPEIFFLCFWSLVGFEMRELTKKIRFQVILGPKQSFFQESV